MEDGGEDIAKFCLKFIHQFLKCLPRDVKMLPLDTVDLFISQHKAQILLPYERPPEWFLIDKSVDGVVDADGSTLFLF